MTKEIFSSADVEQLRARGIALSAAIEQIELMRNPPPAIVLDRPCTVGDGIVRIDSRDEASLLERAGDAAANGRVTKFVPASGAASRMFKDLIAAARSRNRPSDSPPVRELFERLDEFPFAAEVRRFSGVAGAVESESDERAILKAILGEMGYAEKPKGLIPFHGGTKIRTAFEEHLLEGTRYARSADGTCRMHFTVSPESRKDFERTLAVLAPEVMQRTGISTLGVMFSEQHPATDTLAIDSHGEPFRDSSGALLFRPGGHGALLHNLEEMRGDIVVIKNIDNIVPDASSSETVRWKRLLVGFLTQTESEVRSVLSVVTAESTDTQLDDAIAFCAQRFARTPASPLTTAAAKRNFVVDALDRPLRICGVVKNEGEPGGAPFWVVEHDGRKSVQIVESSQVDAGDQQQRSIFQSSTHFNPVDVVCSLRSWRGEAFQLENFVDPATVFLSKKSYEGRELTALERPGLWNGAMARWNTVCVEVPAETFAPVKTVFDLLRPQHR